MLERLGLRAGVSNGMAATAGAAMQVVIGAGGCLVAGTHAGVTRQGLYPGYFPSSETVTLAAANGSNPRIDQVVARVRDTQPAPGVAGDAENSVKIEAVTGTATAGATLANRNGAAARPASSLWLYDVLVPTSYNSAFVPATHFRDRRVGVAPVVDEPGPIKIVRGRVTAAGAVAAGAGFTVAKGATGAYTITFDTNFAVAPTVNATAYAAGFYLAKLQGAPSTSSFVINTFLSTTGAATDVDFSFLAIGPV